MRRLLSSPVVLILLALNLVLGLIYATRYFAGRRQEAAKADQRTIEAAERFEKAGFISKADYLRVVEIGRIARGNGSISDADLEWMLSLLSRRPSGPRDNHLIPLQLMVSGRLLHYVQDYSQPQRDSLFLFFVSTVDMKDKATPADYAVAFSLMEKTADKRAVPYLLPLLNSPQPKVRSGAKNTLAAIGVTAS